MSADAASLIPPALDQLRKHPEAVSAEVPRLLERLAEVPDPRDPRGVRHALVAMLGLTACVVLAGVTSVLAVGEWIADAPPHILERLGIRLDPLFPKRFLPAETTVRWLMARACLPRRHRPPACLLTTSTDADPGVARTWAAMRQLAGGATSSVVVQRYGLPDEADESDGATDVNTLVRLSCSTIVSTGAEAGVRSAVATTLAVGHPRGAHLAVVTDSPVAGVMRVDLGSVSAQALAGLTGGRERP